MLVATKAPGALKSSFIKALDAEQEEYLGLGASATSSEQPSSSMSTPSSSSPSLFSRGTSTRSGNGLIPLPNADPLNVAYLRSDEHLKWVRRYGTMNVEQSIVDTVEEDQKQKVRELSKSEEEALTQKKLSDRASELNGRHLTRLMKSLIAADPEHGK